ncbi:acyl-CoA dehydrogenase family protein [Nocardioides rubriscoriae]|uniref:acyl-CoA dehydrogenase family protein n=1 Tax=Nocardioides rubriscoriae TaxID=642762 RepID=UPI0011DF9EE8|nr:acyl-CoA dehydrogenase family protein [Nocardioides rubriscoriae]
MTALTEGPTDATTGATTTAYAADLPDLDDLRALARTIAADHVAPYAAEVDRDGRFPHEGIDALRGAGLLGAMVPRELGGLGHDVEQAAVVVRELARACASTAMVLAMHHIQVACLVRHADTPALTAFTRRIAVEQLLVASATTEVGIGGDTRSSLCHVVLEGDRFELTKQAPVISYGEHADVVLATARRDADSAASDQVMVVCEREHISTTPISEWNTLGFRGTCSRGFTLVATGPADLVCQVPFAVVSSHTMVPVSHLLWASLWLGMAEEASWRAQRFVQKAARKQLGTTPPGAARLPDLIAARQQLAATVESQMTRYLAIADDPEATAGLDFAIGMNMLKVMASTQVVEIVNRAMLVCGIAGYREDTEFTLGRLLRDAHGAAVMVNNDRIAGNTAQLALVQRQR